MSRTVAALWLALGALAGTAESDYDQPQPKAPVARADSYGDSLPEGAIARVGTTRLRASGSINVIAFSHDGRRLAYGSEDGVVHVCEAAEGKPLFELQPGEVRHRPVTELAFSPDGKTLAASGYWSTAVYLIDVATQKIRHTIPNTVEGHDRWARLWQGPAFAFTPDGRTLIVGGKDGAVHLWDIATGTELAALAAAVKERLVCLTLSADCGTALAAYRGGGLHLWDVTKRKLLRELAVAAKHPHLTALAPDGRTIALATDATELELWNADGGKRRQIRTAAPVAGLAFTPDAAALLVAQTNGSITSWDVATGTKRTSTTCEGIDLGKVPIDDRMGPRLSAWFRADGKMMAWSVGGVIRPWDLTTGQESPRLTGYRQGIDWAGFSSDGRLLRVGGSGVLGMWDAGTGQPHGPPRATDLRGYIPAPDRGRIVGATPVDDAKAKTGGRIFLWDPAGDAGPVALRGQVETARYAALTPDNRFVVATETAGKIRVYDAETGKPVRDFDGRKYEYRPTFSPDGTQLATTASEATVRLYDFASGRLLHQLKGASHAGCVAFSPDGRWLASGHSSEPFPGREQTGDMIYLWDTASGRELRRFPTGHFHVQAVSFTPDGRLIASCGYDRVVRLWEAATGQERWRYDGHSNWVRSVDFDPDGRRLASASLDGTALVWRVFPLSPGETGRGEATAELEAFWADLAKDGKTVHRAAAALIAARATPAFLKVRLKPAVKPTDEQIKSWLADLASPVFRKRDAAHKEIARAGELIEPELQRALKTASDEEMRRRLTLLVDNIPRPETRPEHLRELRAAEVLGHHDSAEARSLLADLAQGRAEASLTRHAKASVARQERTR